MCQLCIWYHVAGWKDLFIHWFISEQRCNVSTSLPAVWTLSAAEPLETTLLHPAGTGAQISDQNFPCWPSLDYTVSLHFQEKACKKKRTGWKKHCKKQHKVWVNCLTCIALLCLCSFASVFGQRTMLDKTNDSKILAITVIFPIYYCVHSVYNPVWKRFRNNINHKQISLLRLPITSFVCSFCFLSHFRIIAAPSTQIP